MSLGLVGRKCGMTRVFVPETGESIPVTVLEMLPNRITQVKSEERDGYRAIQVTAGKKETSKINKPMIGHFKKAKVEAGYLLKEFRLKEDELLEAKVGDALTADLFKVGDVVDVRGISKGKGFAGTVKRWNFHMQDATHGNSLSHRAPGSIGQCQTPGRVIKGKKMAGHMGAVPKTMQNQKIVKIDLERNLLLIRGGVPGAPGGVVIVTPAIKFTGEVSCS